MVADFDVDASNLSILVLSDFLSKFDFFCGKKGNLKKNRVYNLEKNCSTKK